MKPLLHCLSRLVGRTWGSFGKCGSSAMGFAPNRSLLRTCFGVSRKPWGVDSIGVWSVIKPANLNYPDNVVAGFLNDCFFKWFLPQRGVLSIADSSPCSIAPEERYVLFPNSYGQHIFTTLSPFGFRRKWKAKPYSTWLERDTLQIHRRYNQ